MLCRFLSYFGSKAKIAELYPPPRYKTLVEPFAGGAGYSLRHHHKNVVLIEKNRDVYEVWKWLIEKATKEEILSLPVVFTDLRKVDIPSIHKKFIGFHLSVYNSVPRNKPTSCTQWTVLTRSRIARQLHAIKHWRIVHGNFSQATDIVKDKATWFIDPPYQTKRLRHAYPRSAKTIDFSALSDWCQSLPGQVIVCEQQGADWLPFEPIIKYLKGGLEGPKMAREVVWLSEGNYRKTAPGFFREGAM